MLESMTLSADISDWQTYRNDDFNFEFKSPKRTNDLPFSFRNPKDYKLDIQNTGSYISIDVQVGEWTADMIEEGPKVTGEKIVYSSTNFMISAQRTNSPDSPPKVVTNGCDKSVVTIKNSVKYEITEPSSCSLPLDTNLSKIYESFKIIDPNALLETADWQTYKSDKNGFGFKYPNGWKLIDGAITSDVTSNTIRVYYATKDKAPAKTVGVGTKNAQIDFETGSTFANKRVLSSGRSFFQDTVSFKDDKGNYISLDFFNNLQQDESKKIIDTLLSTFKFNQ